MPEVGVSTPQAFRDWDSLCLAEGLTARASADKLEQLSRAYASAFAEAIPEGGQGAGSSGVPSDEGDLAGPESPRLSAPGLRAGSRTTLNASSFPSILPLQKSSAFFWASDTPEAALHASLSGSGSALFGLYRTRGDAEAARERLQQQLEVAEHTDPHPAALGILARDASAVNRLTAVRCARETRQRLQSWAIV